MANDPITGARILEKRAEADAPPPFCPPALAELTPQELIREAQGMSNVALATLLYLSRYPSVWPSVARQAACDILDRAHGKAVQQAIIRSTHTFDIDAVVERLKAIALENENYSAIELLEQPPPEVEVEGI